jgi:hypothetical protein
MHTYIKILLLLLDTLLAWIFLFFQILYMWNFTFESENDQIM